MADVSQTWVSLPVGDAVTDTSPSPALERWLDWPEGRPPSLTLLREAGA